MKVKIFTEGGKSIGLGHMSRCISLYDEVYKRGVSVELIVYGDISDVGFIKGRSVINEDWLNKEYLMKSITREDYVIIDSYKANKELYEIVALNSKKSLYIDDNGRLDYPKGIIINPILDSSHISYSISSENVLLTGSKYVILRSSFMGVKRAFIPEEVRRVLIMMGGTDIRNITSLIIDKICKENKDIIFDIILGNLTFDEVNTSKSLKNVNFHMNLSEKEVSRIMINCDFAITAAGQTIYELIATETPFIAVQVVDNQKNNISSISEYISSKVVLKYDNDNFLENLEKIFIDSKAIDFRKRIIKKMSNLIDGFGRKRIIDALLDTSSKENNIFLRKVKELDVRDVFKLSNQDYVRIHSINKNKIHWGDHVKWFNNIVEDKNVVFYVVTDDNQTFLGQVRYNINNQSATISISLSDKIRGKGLSKSILYQSVEKLFKENMFIEEIIAFVSESNIASKRIFEGLNFTEVSIKDSMIKFMLKKGDFYVN